MPPKAKRVRTNENLEKDRIAAKARRDAKKVERDAHLEVRLKLCI